MDRKHVLAAISLAALSALAPAAAAGAAPVKTGPLSKADGSLQQLFADGQAGRDLRSSGRHRRLRVSGAGRVLADVYVNGDVTTAARQLRKEGMKVEATSRRAPFLVVEGWVPVAAIERIGGLRSAKAVAAVTAFGTNIGTVQSQGDAAHRGPAARATGHAGAGVKVGLISDSINQQGLGVAGSQSGGDLPPTVQVLSDDPGGSDEGRAMGEIVYDEAPGITQMAFASGTASGPAGKANAINSLVANGARVIADDIFYLSEPFFQDGIVAQATDAARARDVAYFASAGNRARQSYESGFRGSAGCPSALTTPPISGPDVCHDFGGGDHIQTLATVPNGDFVQVVLQWDEPWGHAQTDLDAFLVDGSGTPLAAGASNNRTSGLPMEVVGWQNPGLGDTPVGLVIQRFAGSRSPFMKHIADASVNVSIEHPTNSDAIDPDSTAARGALSVGAVRYSQPGLSSPESFSSRGPLRRLFDRFGNRLGTAEIRHKPDIAAADGVSTSLGPPFAPFFGTSAAAPSAAGVAALIRSAKPSITAADVYAILRNRANTIDCTLAGNPDADCGYGFVLADAAMGMATDPSPPGITVHKTKANGRHGWYVRKKKVNVSWTVADDRSPITSTSACAPGTVTKDTRGTTFSCTAHSAGGTITKTVTIRRDSKRPRLSKIAAGKSFRVNPRGRATSARRKGTRIRFRLSEKATATIKVQKRVHGRYRTVRTFKAKGKKGRNSVKFSGRIKRGHRRKKLAVGRYRFRVQAADTAGNRSSVRTRKFRIRK